MKRLLAAVALETGATGLLLIVSPLLFGRLVLGSDLPEAGQAIGRLGGMAMLGFALSCWPAPAEVSSRRAMLVYNVLAAAYLLYLAVEGTTVGVLLVPAVVIHCIFVLIMGVAPAEHKQRADHV